MAVHEVAVRVVTRACLEPGLEPVVPWLLLEVEGLHSVVMDYVLAHQKWPHVGRHFFKLWQERRKQMVSFPEGIYL